MRPFEGSEAGQERGGFCWCPPGRFQMGPGQVDVTLTQGFWMAKYPVAQEQYRRVMGENPSGFRGDRLPVDSVDRAGVTGYCARLTLLELAAGRLADGWEYRLPTEAQWEYACRAGTTTAYFWGDDPDEANDYTWNGLNSGFTSHPAGELQPNDWGLYDMLGNALQWCRDAWLDAPPGGTDPEVTEDDLPGPPARPFWSARGGGWIIPPDGLRISDARIRLGAGDQGYLLGFRVAIVRADAAGSTSEEFQEWGEVMGGRWASEFVVGAGAPGGGTGQRLEGHSSARWVLDHTALEGDYRVGDLRGKWLAAWDGVARQIRQHTVNSDGSTVLTIIAKLGDRWVWQEAASYPDGQTQTGTNIITVLDGGNALEHHHTNQVRGGHKLPDIRSVWRRVGPAH